jgi:hypothetical protein
MHIGDIDDAARATARATDGLRLRQPVTKRNEVERGGDRLDASLRMLQVFCSHRDTHDASWSVVSKNVTGLRPRASSSAL